MKYFKNTELARLYHVSEKSVRNWIAAAAANPSKSSLSLYEYRGRLYIANTSYNIAVIEELVAHGKKFKNSRGRRTLRPKPELYSCYSAKHIIDILTNIDIHSEIPLQYSYFNSGAKEWSAYAQRLLQEQTPNMLTGMVKLLDLSNDYVQRLIQSKTHVSVVDLGQGDASPARDFLSGLSQSGKLKRYIAIDFSKDMMKIAEDNVRTWFGDVPVQTYERDLSYDRFDDVLKHGAYNTDFASSANLILLLGGMLTNFPSPANALRNINASMGRNDFLMYGLKLDTLSSRRFFDFANTGQPLSSRHSMLLELFNIDSSMYDVEQFYDQENKCRVIRVKLKIDITLEVEVEGTLRRLDLHKDQRILIWRYWHQTAMDVLNEFDQNGFDLLQATLTEDKEYLLLIAKTGTS